MSTHTQAAPNYSGPKDCPDEAWELALKVRADLDRISCPGVYMDKAVDAICKRWSAAPVTELVEALEVLLTRWDGCDEDDTPPAVVRVRAALDRLKTPNGRANLTDTAR